MKTTLQFSRSHLAYLTLFILSLLGYQVKAQSTLVAGDIAFTGYNCYDGSTNQNDFSFVILRPGGISAGTTINFTDNGYKIASTNALNTIEGTLVWTSTTAMAQFTQVYIRANAAGNGIVGLSAGSIAGGFSNFILSGAGDQVLAYQGSSASPIFISGIHMNSDPASTQAGWDNIASGTSFTQNRSDVPPGLTSGVNCVAPDPNIGTSERDNGIYNCTGASGATLANIRTAVNTPANWSIQDNVIYALPPSCSFSLSSPLSATTTGTNVSCNAGSNGRASVSASGGAGGYSYSWAPSGGTSSLALGLSVGIYTVTVIDAASASTTATVLITQPSALVATPGFTNASCNGLSNGRASVSVSGGTPSYSYAWAPSGGSASLATGLSANTYTCTITDNNSCTKIQTVTVSQPSAIVSTPSSTSVTCNGGTNGTASVTVSGGTPSYFYSWAPSGGTGAGATGLTAGGYTCTITDNNSCTRTTTVNVAQPSAIATSTSIVNVPCNGYANGITAVSPSGGTSPYTFTWSPSGGNSNIATGQAAGSYTVNGRDNNGCTFSRICNVTQPPALVASISSTNTICNGGSDGKTSVTASGGTPGYSYTWTPSGGNNATATGLSANTYTCAIEDVNGCPLTKTVTVGQPAAISTSTSVTNVTCNGGSNGSASISASGGAGGYSYLWSNGGSTSSITGLLAGIYTATVTDANSCTSIKSADVTQPTALSTSTAVTNVACNGGTGSATVTVSGGTGGYTYLWSNGSSTSAASGLIAGVHTATVTDANNCTSIQSVNVTQPAALSTSTAVTNVACNGGTGSATVTASGGTGGYTYLWSNGGSTSSITGLLAGIYTATVTDANNCTSIQSVNVTQPVALSTSTAVTNALCNGGTGSATITASGGTGGYTYLWSNGSSTSAASGLIAGVHTATVTDANNCNSSKAITITEPSAIVTSTAVTGVLCNGGTGSATVTASGGTGSLTYSWTPSGGTGTTISGMAAGNYTVTVSDANSCIKTAFANITEPSAIITSTAVTNVLCNGGTGSATVTATGGTGSLTYSWTPVGGTGAIASGLSAGNYTVTIKDANNCTATAFADITQPSVITAVPSQTNATCGVNNGTVSVAVSGGTGSYTYSWMPSGGTAAMESGLGAGNFTVAITDANSCVQTQTFTVTATGSISAVTTATAVGCNGGNNGAAAVTASGGAGAFTYTWMPGSMSTSTISGLTAGVYTVQVKDAVNCTVTFTAGVTQPFALAGIITFTNVSCNGASNGIANINISGGTSAYSYTWAPSGGNAATASGLAPGDYTVNVKDANNCTLSRTVSITQPTALSAVISGTNVSCGGGANGAATVTVSGGTGVYTYSWTPTGGTAATASGLPANHYTVTVKDANLCPLTSTIALTEPASMTAITSKTNLTCNGAGNGAAGIVVSGGAGSYTYSWTPAGGTASTATGLSANNYSVTVTDANNCSISRTYTITEPAILSIAMTHTNISCNGAANGIATASVTGGTGPYTYSWTPGTATTPGLTGLNAGTYTVIVKDANVCQTSATVSVTEPVALVAISNQTNVICHAAINGAASVAVSGGTGAYGYTWTPTGGNASSATALAAGNYTVNVKDANNCTLTNTFVITEPAAIVAALSHTNISCFGQTNGAASVNVTGGSGSYTYTWMPGSANTTTIGGLSAGTYTINVKDAANCTVNSTVTIIEPGAITRTQNLSICQGQSVTVGTSTYTAAGTYTNILMSSGGCDSTVTTILAINALPTLTLTASSSTLCAGTSATLTASGATAYIWSNGVANGAGFIPISTQVYTVTGANGGCSVTATIGLTVNSKPTVIANATSTLICNGNAVTLTGSGAITYTWSSGVTNGTAFNPTTTATYTLTGTNASACTNTAVITVSVSPCTGIESYAADVAVMVYPNPVNSTATISVSHFDLLSSSGLSLDLYDNTGRMVKQVSITGAETVLSREGLAEGMYYYHITTEGTTLLKGKLMVQ